MINTEDDYAAALLALRKKEGFSKAAGHEAIAAAQKTGGRASDAKARVMAHVAKCDGVSARDVAAALGIDYTTARQHMQRLYMDRRLKRSRSGHNAPYQYRAL